MSWHPNLTTITIRPALLPPPYFCTKTLPYWQSHKSNRLPYLAWKRKHLYFLRKWEKRKRRRQEDVRHRNRSPTPVKDFSASRSCRRRCVCCLPVRILVLLKESISLFFVFRERTGKQGKGNDFYIYFVWFFNIIKGLTFLFMIV